MLPCSFGQMYNQQYVINVSHQYFHKNSNTFMFRIHILKRFFFAKFGLVLKCFNYSLFGQPMQLAKAINMVLDVAIIILYFINFYLKKYWYQHSSMRQYANFILWTIKCRKQCVESGGGMQSWKVNKQHPHRLHSMTTSL